MSNPHDALFKSVLGKPEHARGVLRSAVPAALAEAIDWPALARRPGSFVDAELGEQFTDLLYSAPWHDGGEALVYFLFEHQSSPSGTGLMAWRLLRYMVRIWEQWTAEHPKATAIPTIIPVVMYHGDVPWAAARSFDALLDVPAGVRPAIDPHLIRFEYLLDDLSEIPDEVLHARAMLTALSRLVMVCFKYGRTRPDRPDLLQVLGSRWVGVLREVARAPNGLDALALVMRYILEVNEHVKRAALQSFLEREIGPEAKEVIVTAGQELIEQGRQEGILQTRRQILLDLLRERFGDTVDGDVERRIAAASAKQLETWTGRVLSAVTLTELLTN